MELQIRPRERRHGRPRGRCGRWLQGRLKSSVFGAPTIAKDGVSVAKEIELKDRAGRS